MKLTDKVNKLIESEDPHKAALLKADFKLDDGESDGTCLWLRAATGKLDCFVSYDAKDFSPIMAGVFDKSGDPLVSETESSIESALKNMPKYIKQARAALDEATLKYFRFELDNGAVISVEAEDEQEAKARAEKRLKKSKIVKSMGPAVVHTRGESLDEYDPNQWYAIYTDVFYFMGGREDAFGEGLSKDTLLFKDPHDAVKVAKQYGFELDPKQYAIAIVRKNGSKLDHVGDWEPDQDESVAGWSKEHTFEEGGVKYDILWNEKDNTLFWVKPQEGNDSSGVKFKNKKMDGDLKRLETLARKALRGGQKSEAAPTKAGFIKYLQDTLIPDLKDAGSTEIAKDFETLIKFMKGAKKADGFEDKQRFLNYLEGTLIPDLRDAGRHGTADDFEVGVNYAYDDTGESKSEKLADKVNKLVGESDGGLESAKKTIALMMKKYHDLIKKRNATNSKDQWQKIQDQVIALMHDIEDRKEQVNDEHPGTYKLRDLDPAGESNEAKNRYFDVYVIEDGKLGKKVLYGIPLDYDKDEEMMSTMFHALKLSGPSLKGQAFFTEIDPKAEVTVLNLFKEPAYLVGPEDFDPEKYPISVDGE